MQDVKQSHHQHGGPNSDGIPHGRGPYWKRAHHDWRFWVALLLMFAAIIIYVMSEDLAWRPRYQRQQPLSGAVVK